MALSVVALAMLGVTVGLGHAVIDGPAETTAPGVAVLFGVGLAATGVLGAELWAVSPLPGKTHPLYADEAEGENWTVYVVGLSVAALLMFGTAAISGSGQFVARIGSPDTLSFVTIGVSLSAGTVLGARVLNVLYRS
ncbi:hypothetical protein [Halococcoides cellulosivorans]|nr:hypothetical protein [Halococcoides cellulosivorans]